MKSYFDTSKTRGDVNQMWILETSTDLLKVRTIKVTLAL